MSRSLFLLVILCFVPGCTYNVRHRINNTVEHLADQPYDVAPDTKTDPVKTSSRSSNGGTTSAVEKKSSIYEVPTDTTADEWMEFQVKSKSPGESDEDDDVQTVSWLESSSDRDGGNSSQRNLDVNIPLRLPGSEAPRVELSRNPATIGKDIDRIYPELPPLPIEPVVLPGPNGKAYTLSDLQRIAAANSPLLRQAIADVEAAKGNLIQSKTYANPTSGWLFDPDNNNTAANTQGAFVDQVIRTAGKQKLGVAATQKDLDNAELALKRARSDLATAVRNAYFTLLVDVETLVVNRSLAQFTDEIYRLHTGLLKGAVAAPYEPASLRAQAFTTRLSYKQAIASYIYDWKQLVATIGEHQLPLTEVAGQVDRLIPYYEYDQVLTYALQNHTDILSTRNIVKKAQYNLKLAQVTPIPDLEVRASWERDKAASPFGTYSQFSIGGPVAVWDQNKGNIIAAQAGVARAAEESHRVEMALTSSLAAAYANYQNNLYAIEYYRRYILPDLVRYYRGIHARRQVDPNSGFADLVAAQQNLSSNITAYLVVLQNTWTSAVSVADFLQTDDLFQLAKPRDLPEMPDFNEAWPCDHGKMGDGCQHDPQSPGRLTSVSTTGLNRTEDGDTSFSSSRGTIRPVANRRATPSSLLPIPTTPTDSDDAVAPSGVFPGLGSASLLNW